MRLKRKTNKKKANKKKTTIKVRLIVLPLILLFIAINSMAVVSSLYVRSSLLAQMREDGIALTNQLVSKIENNIISLRSINHLLEDKISVAAKTVKSNKDVLSNELLKQIAKDSGVNYIHWYAADGNIAYSTDNDYLGRKLSKGDPAENFRASGKNELIEADAGSDNPNMNGYLRNKDGSFIQVGIRANQVESLVKKFSHQTFVEELAKEENIVYATIIDKNLKAIADSDAKDIGVIYDKNEEIGMVQALKGSSFTNEWYYDVIESNLLEMTVPVFVNGEVNAILDIGISMKGVYSAIKTNIISFVILGISSFVIMGILLIRRSNYVISTINNLKESLGYISSGDLTKNVSQKDLNKTDELGDISRAVDIMQNSIQDMVNGIANTSANIFLSSEKVSSISEESAMASDEIAKTVEEIAKGATNQAKQTEEGFNDVNILGERIEENQKMMDDLNTALKQVEILKNEGVKTLDVLVENTKKSSIASKGVYNVIVESNKSAEKIDNASQMIKNIADQTNLLALNAAIEAARAGEAGKGFAVVADEIRKLAEQSNSFTDEIFNIIGELGNKTSVAVKTMEEVSRVLSDQSNSVEQTNFKFDGISNSIDAIMDIIIKLNESSKEMENRKTDIITIIENLAAVSEENAASTEEASAAAQQQTASMAEVANSIDALVNLAEEMKKSIAKFNY
nr:methyl-accepting chemotaxis protein [Abyssisolibacter fermentans]